VPMRMRPSLCALWIMLLFSGLCGNRADAKPTTNELAKAHFELGRAQYNHGDYEGALREFDESFKLQAAPLLLYNAGLAARKAGHDAIALKRFEDYLQRAPEDAAERVETQRYVDELRATVPAGEPAPTTPPMETAPAVPAVTVAPAVAPLAVAPTTHKPVYKQWWLWTAVGVVVAAGVGVGVGLALSQGDNFKPTLPEASLTSVTVRLGPYSKR
jgi:tetratricopeptide (TPR) repeat protein